MAVDLRTTVVVLGAPQTPRLEVGSFESVTDHINAHVHAGQQPFAAGEPAGPGGPLQYFSGEGQRLGVEVDGTGAYSLVETGDFVEIREVRAGVKDALKQYAAVTPKPFGAPKKLKLDKDWPTGLENLADLLGGSTGMAMAQSSGSWFHNFFVHGWH